MQGKLAKKMSAKGLVSAEADSVLKLLKHYLAILPKDNVEFLEHYQRVCFGGFPDISIAPDCL